MLYFRRKSIRNFKNVLIFHTLKYFKRITILFDLLLSTSVFPPTKQSIDLFPFLRLLLSRVTLFAPSVPLKKKQEKGKQESHKQLNAFPAPKLHPIKGNSMCVCVVGVGGGGVVELRGIPRGRVLVLEFLLHKLSFEWLSVTLALLKCSLLSSFLFPKALHRPAQILVHVLPRSH